MSWLSVAARRVRHLPLLRRADFLWDVLRAPYRRLLDAHGKGLHVVVGRCAPLRIPVEYSGVDWETYEPQAVAALTAWVARHPGGLVLDVGSSTGIFSAVALSSAPGVEAIAFDSDLASLAAARRLCRHAGSRRLRLIHGFVSDETTDPSSVERCAEATAALLSDGRIRGDVGTTRYICLGDSDAQAIPSRRLDDLVPSGSLGGRRVLLKCDVEGAELRVLRGARRLLGEGCVDLLLSVHPPALPRYGGSVAEVRGFLAEVGYEASCIAVDHEEHWWCEPRSPAIGGHDASTARMER